jgi:hypothetical protein
MIDDRHDTVRHLVHIAFEPMPDVQPSRDLWPDVLAGLHHRPGLSRFDLALIGLVIASLLWFPQHLALLLWCV